MEIETFPAEFNLPWASTEKTGIEFAPPYVPATTVVLASESETLPAVPPPVRPVPAAT